MDIIWSSVIITEVYNSIMVLRNFFVNKIERPIKILVTLLTLTNVDGFLWIVQIVVVVVVFCLHSSLNTSVNKVSWLSLSLIRDYWRHWTPPYVVVYRLRKINFDSLIKFRWYVLLTKRDTSYVCSIICPYDDNTSYSPYVNTDKISWTLYQDDEVYEYQRVNKVERFSVMISLTIKWDRNQSLIFWQGYSFTSREVLVVIRRNIVTKILVVPFWDWCIHIQ